MDYKKKEEVSFDTAKVKKGQTTVQGLRTMFISEAIVKHHWAGTTISKRQVPMDTVPDKKITRSLDTKSRIPKKGIRRIKNEENSSDEEELLDLGRLSMSSPKKKRTANFGQEEYVQHMLVRLKKKVAEER